MINVKKEGVLLEKTALGFEHSAVINPAVWQSGNDVHLLYRAVRRGNFSTIGFCRLHGPLDVVPRDAVPVIRLQHAAESQGMKHRRVGKRADTGYCSDAGYEGVDALCGLAVSDDLRHFEGKGISVPQLCVKRFGELVQSGLKVNEKYSRE